MKLPSINVTHLHLLRQLHRAPIYPILLTVYPILFLYAFNIHEVSLNMLWLPMAAALGLAIILLLIARKVMRGWNRAALWFTGFGVLFFGYGHLVSLFNSSFNVLGLQLQTDLVILVAFGVILALFSWWLWRNRHFHLGQLNVVINVMSFILIMVSAVDIIPTEVSKLTAKPQEQVNTTVNAAQPTIADPAQNPDVYYLVFDRYGGEQTLRDLYGIDNSAFYTMLESKGFYIARDSMANYPSTSFSLSSTLNMKYHEQLDTSGSAYPSQADYIYPLFKNYEAGKVFKEHGYKVIQLGSWFTYTHQDGIADENYALGSSRQIVKLDAFTSKLVSTTALYPILEEVAPGVIKNNNYESHYLYTEYQRQKFGEVVYEDGPKFVFTHILVPHDPFIYDANCNLIEQSVSEARQIIERYADMMLCANKMAETMIDQIRLAAQEDKRPDPVILIQADEGSYPLLEWRHEVGPYDSKTTEQLLERFRILNAYYLPDGDYGELNQNITPVNSFRVVFNDLFDSSYEKLPDTSYRFKDGEHMFDFIDVTNQLHAP